MRKLLLVLATLALFATLISAQDGIPKIIDLKERARVIDTWLEARFERVVPMLMRREGIDMWLVIAREYNEDPVIETMLPAKWHAARRRTILMFFDRGEKEGVERIAVARYDIGTFFERAWFPEKNPDQWQQLATLIAERNPKKIGLNISVTSNHADGLTKSQYDQLVASLPEDYISRIVSAEKLAVGWLETRITEEMVVYPQMCAIAHVIIAEGLSDRVIQPGITTTEDVQWWYRERIQELKLDTWFHPSVSIQRADTTDEDLLEMMEQDERIILPGDLIHIDFGITYLRLNTDTQQHAYVLRPGEDDAPEGLKKALAVGNRLQDILTSNFVLGRSGNEILKASLDQAKAEGIKPSIYTHPLGFHGHAAGPTIGLWDQQGGVPGEGDFLLYANTAYSIELNATVAIPEWNGKEIRIALEEDAFFDGSSIWYIDGRQEQFHLISKK